MKQMYKVFINDKEVRFLTGYDVVPNDAHELSPELSAAEIVSRVQTFPLPGMRIFYIRNRDVQQQFKKFIAYFPVIKAAGGVVRSKELTGPILMIHRLGKWDLPKGKIDADESPENAAIREVQEECGIGDLQIVRKLAESFHIYELKGMTVVKKTQWYLMLSDYTGQLQPQLEEGITEVKWIDEKDVYFLLPDAYASISELLSKVVLNS